MDFNVTIRVAAGDIPLAFLARAAAIVIGVVIGLGQVFCIARPIARFELTRVPFIRIE